MNVHYYRRILWRELPDYEVLGWVIVGGHESPSVGSCALVQWMGSGEPKEPRA